MSLGWRAECVQLQPELLRRRVGREGAQDAEDAPVPRVVEARNARSDLAVALRNGRAAEALGPKLGEARTQFVEAAGEGVALNKWGRRYRRRAVQDLESALRQVPDDSRAGGCGRRPRRPAALVDDMTRSGLSGSRVRSVVNALRSLYRWAQDRELVVNNPAELCACRRWTPSRAIAWRRRTSSPRCSRRSPLDDALPYALAAYGTARHQEIRDARLVRTSI